MDVGDTGHDGRQRAGPYTRWAGTEARPYKDGAKRCVFPWQYVGTIPKPGSQTDTRQRDRCQPARPFLGLWAWAPGTMDLQRNDSGKLSAGGAAVSSGPLPVCAEVAVRVEGIRPDSAPVGPGKPFKEETQTLLIFPHGAVLALAAPVAADQSVVLIHPGAGRQVRCRVAYVRARPGDKAYVELVFTQPAQGFWDAAPPQQAASQPQAAALPPPMQTSLAPPEKPAAKPAPSAEAEASRVPPAASPVASYGQTNWVKRADEVVGIHKAPKRTEERKVSRPVPAPAPFRETPSAATGSFGRGAGLTAPPPRHFGTSLLNPVQPITAEPTRRRKGISRVLVFGGAAAVLIIGVSVGAMFYFQGQSSDIAQAELPAPPAPVPPPEAGMKSEVVAAAARVAATPSNAIQPEATASQGAPLPASIAASPPVTPAPPPAARPAAAREESSVVVSQAPPRQRVDTSALSAPLVKQPSAVPGEEPAPSVEVLSEAIPAAGSISGLVPGAPRTVPASALSPVQPPKPAAIGGRVKPPRPLKSAPPVYPPVARQRKMEGDVAIEATVDASGTVTTMRVVSGPAFFHQVALDAMRNWKYQPATLNDQPVSADVLVVLKFRMNK